MRKKKLDTHISPRLSEISQARCRGATKKEIAELLGISLATLNRAQRENEDLALALRPVPAQEMEREKIKEKISHRIQYYSKKMQLEYLRVTIRNQKTRWGSCSSAGNLNFNWKLVLMPSELLDYVVVHELAHRKEMHHSPRFWAVVEKELPDYRERREKLKKMGKQLG